MRDLSADHALLSLNTATVRKQGDLLAIVEACARHGVRAVSPWRDQVAAVGLDRAVRAVKDAGLELSGYCRGGMFPADSRAPRGGAGRQSPRGRRGGGARRALPRPRGRRPAAVLPTRLRAVEGPAAPPMPQVEDGIAELLEYARAANMPLAIEPLHPMYAADRACVNTLEHALDLCDRLDPGAPGRRSASRSTSTTSGGIRSCRPRSRAAAATACSPTTSATGSCRRATCSSTAA